MILNKSLNMRDSDVTEFTTQLTSVESQCMCIASWHSLTCAVFAAGYQSSIEYENWRNRKDKKITAASVLTSSSNIGTRKRKRPDESE